MELPVVLCVDDEPIILQSIRIELKNSVGAICSLETAESGKEALEICQSLIQEKKNLAILISDQNMPGMKGHELLSRVKKDFSKTFTILLTGFSDLEGVKQAINKANLYRYITKPWKKEELVFTVREALRAYSQQQFIIDQSSRIEKLTFSLVTALETAHLSYDKDTSYHIQRVSEYTAFLAQTMGYSSDFVYRIQLYSKLHDIGKVGIDHQILNKPGSHTPQEYEIMKKHVWFGKKILDVDGIDEMAKLIAYYHHERWDGTGYLMGLKGEEIPLEARITAVADVFDALASKRVYKPAMAFNDAFQQVVDGSGTHFDPKVIEAFSKGKKEIAAIRQRVYAMEDPQAHTRDQFKEQDPKGPNNHPPKQSA